MADHAATIAVAGGTGLVGRRVVEALRDAGREVVVLARSAGVDLITGDGLRPALDGVRVVVDVTNTPVTDPAQAREFFETTTSRLLMAEEQAGVRHHVVLSIVGVDRVEGNGHYVGKRRQEELAEAGPIPTTVLRATQFHEFAGMVVSWTRDGDVATVPPLLIQPVAVTDLAEVLAEIATQPARPGRLELAGPDQQDLVDMARRTLAAHGESLRLIPSWKGLFGTEMAGNVLLPGADARIGATTFDTWLASQAT
jgi:uncharacterized protein YbjT (DUF2867 family)